ncbi:hypothetical protein [Spongorhabdus nitratireducens]
MKIRHAAFALLTTLSLGGCTTLLQPENGIEITGKGEYQLINTAGVLIAEGSAPDTVDIRPNKSGDDLILITEGKRKILQAEMSPLFYGNFIPIFWPFIPITVTTDLVSGVWVYPDEVVVK